MNLSIPNKRRKVLKRDNDDGDANREGNDDNSNNNNNSVLNGAIGSGNARGNVEFIQTFDGSIASAMEEAKKKELIIPMIDGFSNDKKRERENEDSSADVAASASSTSIANDNSNNIPEALPILIRNQPPELRDIKDEKKRYEIDIKMRPKELNPDEDAYNKIPVEGFGRALLLGMNYDEKKGIGVGKNAKVIKPYSLESRPTLLGLGMTRQPPVEDESRDGYYSSGSENKGRRKRKETEDSINSGDG